MALSTSEAHAVHRAIELGLASQVRRLHYGRYEVPSTSEAGVTHTVRVEHGHYTCDCLAGQHGKACKHAAAVLIATVERASHGRVTRPACATETAGRPPKAARAAAPAPFFHGGRTCQQLGARRPVVLVSRLT